MPSHREVLSPLTTPNIQRQVNKFISPSTSRHVSLKSPVPMLTGEHDDTAEKRERRRSRIIQLQQTVGSPVSPAERRRSLPLSGLSANQLAEHYASCIKLSAENKINSKNAFGLHLIDYMSDLVKKKELDNFQVASTTLDASAKIYAGRVDAIHAETYKVLTGLGRGSDKNKQAEEDENEEQITEDQGEEKAKKKKKAKKNHAVETNLKNISLKKLDLGFEVDPLFHVMSKTFDEGGSSGLLLNNLRCFDDDQALVLDSHTSTVSADQLSSSQRTSTSLTEIKDMFKGVDIASNSICPPFSSFDFTDWDSTMETSVVPSTSSALAFDLNAEPEPIMETETDAVDMPVDITDFPADGGFGDDDNAESDSEQQVSEKSVFIGDGKAAQLMQSAIRDLTHGNTGTLLSVLASEPSDYSYFNKALCRIWAGPSHWRRGPLSKDPRFKSIADKSQKAKKTVFRIDYDEEEDFTSYLKQSKGTCLTKATLTKYSKERNTLPKDLHYDADKLFRLFCKSKVMIKRQNTSSENIDDDIENYDYENANDRENFCPKGSADDDDDDGGGDFDFNFTQGGDNYSQEPSDFMTQPDDTLLSGTMLTGDKLVAQPNKVAKINIDYAKTAKKLDVKRLKGTIWKLLMKKGKNQTEEIQKDDVQQESSGETSGENAEQTEEQNKERGNSPESDKSEEEMQGSCSFQELLNDLPQNVSGNMAKNISVPIAFVCLLHLANEKTLKIESDNMTDLKITQGI